MGLREAKKQRLRQQIQDTSIRLFREQGVEATRVRDIIDLVQISEATFFNYFPSKGALLTEWAYGLIAPTLEPREPGQPGPPFRRQLRELVRRVGSRVEADREFLASIWPRLRAAPDAAALAAWSDAAVDRFRDAQSRGEVRGDVPPEQLAELLSGAIQHTVASWVLAPGGVPESLVPRLLRAVDLVLDGCRKRNERVRARGVARPIQARTL